jgi:glycosyltransferase involved in cell wall biosynthesis
MVKEVLYLSSAVSEKQLLKVLRANPNFGGMAAQKFNRLVFEGFAMNSCRVVSLSTMSQPGVVMEGEESNGVSYRYVPNVNIVGVRYVWRFFYIFFYVLFWGIGHHKEKSVVCDVLNISSSAAAIVACLFNRVRTVGIVTDVPTYSFNRKMSKSEWINFRILGWFDYYVFLTEQMNSVINKKNCPYIVMEGLVNVETDAVASSKEHKIKETNKQAQVKIILFAGGVGLLNGIPILLESFKRIKDDNLRLDLYGFCNIPDIMDKAIAEDNRIKLYGVRPSSEVEEAEKRAYLLVNPRNIHNPCVPYSFPSKNLEYMISGTPVITTRMCCIPQDHHEHLFFFPEREDAEMYAKAIEHVLRLPLSVLNAKAEGARDFVLKQKNNKVQTAKILQLIGM